MLCSPHSLLASPACRKKSKKVDLEAFERELAEDGPAAAGAGGMAEDGDVDPAVPSYGENELGENVFGEGAGPEEASSGTGEGDADQAWQGSDRDYTYEEVRRVAALAYTFLMFWGSCANLISIILL